MVIVKKNFNEKIWAKIQEIFKKCIAQNIINIQTAHKICFHILFLFHEKERKTLPLTIANIFVHKDARNNVIGKITYVATLLLFVHTLTTINTQYINAQHVLKRTYPYLVGFKQKYYLLKIIFKYMQDVYRHKIHFKIFKVNIKKDALYFCIVLMICFYNIVRKKSQYTARGWCKWKLKYLMI